MVSTCYWPGIQTRYNRPLPLRTTGSFRNRFHAVVYLRIVNSIKIATIARELLFSSKMLKYRLVSTSQFLSQIWIYRKFFCIAKQSPSSDKETLQIQFLTPETWAGWGDRLTSTGFDSSSLVYIDGFIPTCIYNVSATRPRTEDKKSSIIAPYPLPSIDQHKEVYTISSRICTGILFGKLVAARANLQKINNVLISYTPA